MVTNLKFAVLVYNIKDKSDLEKVLLTVTYSQQMLLLDTLRKSIKIVHPRFHFTGILDKDLMSPSKLQCIV